MKRYFAIAILTATIGLLSACNTMTATHRLGSVKTVSDHTLQLCFDPQATPPIAGQQVQLVRREQFGNPKFAPTFRERHVGTAEIGTAVTGRCVDARLVQGKARRHDGVYPELGDVRPR